MAFDPDAYLNETAAPSFDPDAYLAGGSGGARGLTGAAVYGLQGAMRTLTSPLDIPGQLMNLVTGRQDRTLGQTVRQGIGSVQEQLGTLTGRSAPGTRYQYENIEEVPPEFRASARAGEATGAAIPFIGGLSLAARGAPIAQTVERALAAPASTGVGAAGAQSVRQMVADAASNPYFIASQIPATAGAAAGGYAAETIFPGSELAQLAGQFSGGLLGAAGAAGATAGGRAGLGQARGAIPGTEEAARATAGRELAPILQQAGEAPEQIIQRLRTPDIVPGALPAELAQSRGVTGVQRLLASQDPELANLVAASRERVGAGIQAGVREAFEPGAPEALTQAAAVRQRGFAQRLDDLVTRAEQKAQSAVSQVAQEGAERVAATRQRAAVLGEQAAGETAPIAPLTPGQARGLNVQARTIIEDALSQARAEERRLWDAIPGNLRGQPASALDRYDTLRGEMLPEERFPALVENVINRYRSVVDEGGAVDFNDLKRLRTRLLTSEREARASNEFDNARLFREIANGVLDDMTRIGGNQATAAREFSRELNDRFSRSFAGDVLGTKPSGAERVRPELTLEAATAGAPERVAAQLGELRTAVAEQGPAMQAVQQDFLRTLTERIIDPTTGAVIPRRADAFLRDNAAILEQFPQMRDAIRSAANAQRTAGEAASAVQPTERAAAAALTEAQRSADAAVRNVLKQTGDAARQAEKTAAFSRVLAAGERPERAVATAVNSANPVRDLTRLSTLALRGGKDAAAGLRASTLKYAMDDAMKGSEVSYGKLSQTLTDPLSNRGESILQVLQRNKIMTADQRSQVEAFVKRGIERELADTTGLEVKEFGKVAGLAGRYIPRIIGAKLSTFVSGGGAGESIQIANMGANVGERIASKLPADKVNQVMAQALKADTPDELISILEYAAAYTPTGASRSLDPFTREAITALRAMLLSPGYEPERPPGGAAAFRPEALGR